MKISDQAIIAILNIVRENPDLNGLPVRFYMSAGPAGCGPAAPPKVRVGFEDETPGADDIQWSQGGLEFLMTKRDALFLNGFELDYSEKTEEKGFICRR